MTSEPGLDASRHETVKAIGLSLLSYVAFSSGDVLVKLSAEGYSVFQIGLTLALAAQIPVLLLTIGRGGPAALVPRSWPLVLARSVLITLGSLCAWAAFTMMPLADGYAIFFGAPLLVTALSALVLGEQVGWRRWSATIVGFVGVLVMIRPDFATLGAGHALAATTTLCSSISFIVLKRIGGRETSASILFVLFACTAAACLPGALLTWRAPAAGDLALMAGAGLLMGAGHALIVVATRRAPANLLAPFQYTQMLWAVFYGMVIFGDRPHASLWLGLAIVVAAGLYTLWRETVRGRVPTLGAARGEVTARVARLPPRR